MTAPEAALRTEIAVSMLGLDAWRMYRQGVHPGVIWDLHVGDQEFMARDLHVAYEVLHTVLRGDIYPDAAHLANFILGEVAQLNEGKQITFDSSTYVMPPGLTVALDVTASDPDATVVAQLMTFMYRAAQGSQIAPEFLNDLARIWFAIYDAALLVAPEVLTA